MEKSQEFKNLQSLAKSLAGKQLITNDEFQAGLTDIINAFAQYRSASQEVNKETRETLNLIVKQVNQEHDRILSEVKNETTATSQNLTKQLKLTLDKVNSLYLDILATKPKDGENGLDADEEKIIEEILKKIPKQEMPEMPDMEALNEEIDSKFKKVYDHIKKSINGFPGVRLLSSLMDVDLSQATITDGKYVIPPVGGGGSGGGILFETPTGAVNGVNVTFTVLNTPLYIVADQQQYFEDATNGYTLSGLTVTMPIAPNGIIRSAYASATPTGSRTTDKTSNGTITGLVNGVNVTYTLSSTPINNSLDLYYQGQLQEITTDYTLVGDTITMVSPPDTGTNLIANYYA